MLGFGALGNAYNMGGHKVEHGDEEVRLNDIVRLRKMHPCGSFDWQVIRRGADVKIRCLGCSRVVMLDRQEFLKRRKAVISLGDDIKA